MLTFFVKIQAFEIQEKPVFLQGTKNVTNVIQKILVVQKLLLGFHTS